MTGHWAKVGAVIAALVTALSITACGSSSSSSSTSASTVRRSLQEASARRHLAVGLRGLLRSGRGSQEGLRALGPDGQRKGWDPRAQGAPEDRRRRVEPEPGRHQLREPDHARPCRPRLRPVLDAAHGAGGQDRQPLRIRVPGARGRWPGGVRREVAQRLLHPASAGRRLRGSVRQLAQDPAGQPASRRPPPTRPSTIRSPGRSWTAPVRSSRRWASRRCSRRSTRRRPRT